MKIFLALVVILGLTFASPFTLITHGNISATLEISTNSANGSNADVIFTLDYPDPISAPVDETVNTVICFDTENVDYSVATGADNLTTIGMVWTCSTGSGNCVNIANLNNAFEARKSTQGDASRIGFNTVNMTAFTKTFVGSQNTTDQTAIQTASGLTEVELETNGLPNFTSTAYYRCFGKLGTATATNLSSDIPGVEEIYTAEQNVTVTAAGAGYGAGLAIVAVGLVGLMG